MTTALLKATRLSRPQFMFGRNIDILFLGGISILSFAVFQIFNQTTITPQVVSIAAAAAFLCNYPHYAATYFRVYKNPEEVKRYPWGAVVTPLVLLALGAVSFFNQATLAPLLVKVYLVANGYHYSGQTYGVALVTAGRQQVVLNSLEKFCVLAPVYLSYLYLLFASEVAGAARDFYGVKVPPLGVPSCCGSIVQILFAVSALAYVLMNLNLRRRTGRAMPFVSHLVVGAQLFWFTVGVSNEAYYYFVPFFHCLQYLLVTAYFDFKETMATNDAIKSLSQYVQSLLPLRYYLIQIVVGGILFGVIPKGLALVTGQPSTQADVILALVVTVINLHHFILDGCIWKLRKPDVRTRLVA